VDVEHEVGCADCRGDDAEAAYRHYKTLPVVAELIDDSHFIVQIRRCGAGGQAYLWIFAEFVDWPGGQDAQYRTILPITDEEVGTLTTRGEQQDLRALEGLGVDRRYLRVDWPSGLPDQRVYWSSGRLVVVPGH
jgi:hypothetical protein